MTYLNILIDYNQDDSSKGDRMSHDSLLHLSICINLCPCNKRYPISSLPHIQMEFI